MPLFLACRYYPGLYSPGGRARRRRTLAAVREEAHEHARGVAEEHHGAEQQDPPGPGRVRDVPDGHGRYASDEEEADGPHRRVDVPFFF